MKNQNTTIIEITDSHIKILEAQTTRAGSKIKHCEIKTIVERDDKETARLLKTTVAASKLKIKHLVAVIPRRFAMLRVITLPSHAGDEIAKMVSLQIVRQTPYPPEDVVFDHLVLDKDPSGYTKVLIVIVHKDVINRYLNILAQAGLHANAFTLSSFGLLRWFNFHQKESRAKDNRPVAVVHIDAAFSEICFCENEKLFFSRGIDLGTRDLAEEQIPSFVNQIILTVKAYTKEEGGREISRIVILSAMNEANLLREKLRQEYPFEVDLVSSVEHIDVLGKRTMTSLVNDQGATLVVAQGLSFPSQERAVNLLPKEVADTRKTKEKKTEWVRFIVLLFFAVILGGGVFGARVYRDTVYLKQINRMIQAADPQVKSIKDKMDRLAFARKKFNQDLTSVDIVHALYQATPQRVSFNSLQLSEEGTLDLKGISEDGTSVNDFQNNLVQSSFFKDVNLQYATKRRVFQGEVTDFKITCSVVNPQEVLR